MMADPKELIEPGDREMARGIRDGQWAFMEDVAKHDPAWWCWWDKNQRYRQNKPDDVLVTGLITACELFEWQRKHPDWWDIGKWDDAHYAAPARLTVAGREALANRHLYDMEAVTGGMVEPGWTCIPAAPAKGSAA